MNMNQHQNALWQKMIDLIQSYMDGKSNDFFSLVGQLEGALDASELNDQNLVEQWYNYWTPLETRRAIQGNNVDRQKVFEELKEMKEFLLRTK